MWRSLRWPASGTGLLLCFPGLSGPPGPLARLGQHKRRRRAATRSSSSARPAAPAPPAPPPPPSCTPPLRPQPLPPPPRPQHRACPGRAGAATDRAFVVRRSTLGRSKRPLASTPPLPPRRRAIDANVSVPAARSKSFDSLAQQPRRGGVSRLLILFLLLVSSVSRKVPRFGMGGLAGWD